MDLLWKYVDLRMSYKPIGVGGAEKQPQQMSLNIHNAVAPEFGSKITVWFTRITLEAYLSL